MAPAVGPVIGSAVGAVMGPVIGRAVGVVMRGVVVPVMGAVSVWVCALRRPKCPAGRPVRKVN